MKNIVLLALGSSCLLVLSSVGRAANYEEVKEEIRAIGDSSRFLWASGSCIWSEKHYAEIPVGLLDAIKSGQLASQFPLGKITDPDDNGSVYPKIVAYLERYGSPTYSSSSELLFNKDGWRLDEYTDISQLSPKPSDVIYLNPNLPIQGKKTTLQIGDKRWTRLARDQAYVISQGAQINPGKNIPTAFGNLLPMFFVDNLFIPVPGRETTASKEDANQFKVRGSANEGVTDMTLKNVKGVIVMEDQKTLVSGTLFKLGGEYGEVAVKGPLAKDGVVVPHVLVDVTFLERENKVNVIVRKIDAFRCEEVTSETLMKPLSEVAR